MAADQMVLPGAIVTRADVGRLVKEAEAIDNTLNQAAIRGGDAEGVPKTSKLLEEMAASNKLNLSQKDDRQRLLEELESIRTKAPVLHVSFNTDPSPIFQQRLVTWIRQQLHPSILLHIGLHPNIGAGCVIRTDNKFFDFSLRQRFVEKRGVLVSKLRGEAVVADTSPSELPSEHAPEPAAAAPPAEGNPAP